MQSDNREIINPETIAGLSEIEYIQFALKHLGIHPRKSRGQNFLFDSELGRSLLRFASVKPNMPVLEIGPGLGIMTRHLVEQTNHLRVVEIEPGFCKLLPLRIPRLTPAQIIEADIRSISLPELYSMAEPSSVACHIDERVTIVSNVPYSVSTDIVLWLVEHRACIRKAVLLLQREFAERLVAQPGSKAYGSLSVLLRLLFDGVKRKIVFGHVFYPKAKVESALIEITPLEKPRYDVANIAIFEKTVRQCFSMRRKTILNNLVSGIHLDFARPLGKEEAQRILTESDISPMIRGEMLDCEDFVRLTNSLIDKNLLRYVPV